MNNLDVIMHNLMIVKMVREQDKLITGPRFGLRNPTTLRALLRRWNGEDRGRDLENLRSLLSSALCLAQLQNQQSVPPVAPSIFSNTGPPLISAQPNVVTERLIEAICGALEGMHTLTRTYHDDQETCARIELLVRECQDGVNAISPGRFARGGAGPCERGTPPDTTGTDAVVAAVAPSRAPSPCSPRPRDA